MNDINWARQQIALENAVRRVSIPGVYLKQYSPSWSPWAPVTAIHSTSNDSVIEQRYFFTLDDAAATDWELHE